jgi:small-conductance mechanosensitive channel
LALAGLVAIILMLPIGDTRQGQLLSLLGILLSAAIALSSTTLVGNAMAGMMIRALRNFRPGDFIRVGDYFGRVSDRGLFHVEIQTEDRDLTTLPNLYLVTNPVKVTRASGTMVTAEVSLGYDVGHGRVRELLERAARAAKLQDPFAHVIALNDFSVTYRISGLLEDVKQLLSVRSLLREKMLDELHRDGIEIVSPTFMNTRALPENKTFIPRSSEPSMERGDTAPRPVPEDLIFDKAEEAESVEKLIERHDLIGKEIEEIKVAMKGATDEKRREEMKTRVTRLETARNKLAEIIKKRKEESQE